MSIRRVEVLYFDGCPNTDLALRRAREAVRLVGVEADVTAVKIEGSEDAATHRFLGSPSVRVDGKDVEGVSSDESYALRCRVYSFEGRMEHAPPVEWIAAALRGKVVTGSVATDGACCSGASDLVRTRAVESADTASAIPAAVDIDAVVEFLSSAFPPGTEAVVVGLVRLLAEGAPVSPSVLAESLGWRVEQVAAALARIPSIEYEADKITAAGLSIREAPHVLEVDGRRLYTWCALDALFVPALLSKTCRVSSSCPGTGRPIRLTVTPEALVDQDPQGVAVSLAMGDCSGELRQSFCDRVRFFVSPAVARHSMGANWGGLVMSIEDAFLLGQELVRRLAWRA